MIMRYVLLLVISDILFNKHGEPQLLLFGADLLLLHKETQAGIGIDFILYLFKFFFELHLFIEIDFNFTLIFVIWCKLRRQSKQYFFSLLFKEFLNNILLRIVLLSQDCISFLLVGAQFMRVLFISIEIHRRIAFQLGSDIEGQL